MTFKFLTAEFSVRGQMTEADLMRAVAAGFAAVICNRPLADASGFIEVDPATLRHARFPNIFALGDAINTSNAKTAAAARKQAPVVAMNATALLAPIYWQGMLKGREWLFSPEM